VGEEIAASFLERHGYKIIAKNVRTTEGEIDLIAEYKGEVIFCEVKTRKNNSAGFPEEAVTDEKMEHMLDSAESYLSENPQYGDNWRVDVISVTGDLHDAHPQIEWFENGIY
jgi:putative endonuclease